MVDYRDIKRQLPQPAITFTTDFGLSDESVGAMEVSTAKLCPQARFFHNTHGARNIKEGAWLFWSYLHYTPNGAHVAVVDPGVGTERRALAIELTRKDSKGNNAGVDYLVGPDNGLLIPALNLGEVTGIADIDFDKVGVDPVSSIFHGRDIFGPAAAYLASLYSARTMGVGNLAKVGKDIISKFDEKGRVEGKLYRALQKLEKAPYKPATKEDGKLTGEIIRADNWRNTFTNIPLEWAEKLIGYGNAARVELDTGAYKIPLGHTFASVPKGELVLTDNAYRQVQIALNQGYAAERLGYFGCSNLDDMASKLGEETVRVTIEKA